MRVQAGIRRDKPTELRRKYRGCKAGAKVKATLTDKQTCFKPSIHSIMMGNVKELVNKMDELLVPLQTSCTKNANVDLPGFAGVRTNRSNKACRKSKSG